MAAAKPRDLTQYNPFTQPATTGDPLDPQSIPAGGENVLDDKTVTPNADTTGGNPLDALKSGSKPYKLSG